jgi:bacterioferritin-associated ferredoxin
MLLRINRRRFASVYICICNAIRESELRRVARHVSGDAEDCYAALGKRPNCGSCLDDAEDVLFEERELGFRSAAAA